MAGRINRLLHRLRRSDSEPEQARERRVKDSRPPGEVAGVYLPANDPFLAYVHDNPGVIDVRKLKLDSPTVERLKAEGYQLTLPLLSQGELIGLLNLGPKMSEQDYSTEDQHLLNSLATQASPALRVAQLAQQQLVEAKELERMEQELRLARVIQETLLPKEIPALPGWEIDVYWQPAREVGGDFYDFIELADGRFGIMIADVTDKGVPAAMVVATSRSLLRAAAERLTDPGAVLERANHVLYPDIPARMFVTCVYLILDPATGEVRFANAGHNLPYRRGAGGVDEVRATGMPLGLLPDMTYEEAAIQLELGDVLLLSSDGIVEAHNTQKQMYGFPRLQGQLEAAQPDQVISHLVDDLGGFVGEGHEQEDDITLLSIRRTHQVAPLEDHELASFALPSERGNEREAASRVVEAVSQLDLPVSQLKRLETAVAEAVMNAMEHGNAYHPERPVDIRVFKRDRSLVVHVRDQGGARLIPESTSPNLDAKLAGDQSPRGWGLFLIENMVDEVNHFQSDGKTTIELILTLEGSDSDGP